MIIMGQDPPKLSIMSKKFLFSRQPSQKNVMLVPLLLIGISQNALTRNNLARLKLLSLKCKNRRVLERESEKYLRVCNRISENFESRLGGSSFLVLN